MKQTVYREWHPRLEDARSEGFQKAAPECRQILPSNRVMVESDRRRCRL